LQIRISNVNHFIAVCGGINLTEVDSGKAVISVSHIVIWFEIQGEDIFTMPEWF
jgi:hypothetical protein